MRNTLIDTVVNYVNGQISDKFSHDAFINNVVIDSRKASANSLFVAIKGDNQDGHDYVKNIVDNENCFALVDKNFKEELPNLIYVEDTVVALGQLAHNYRKEFDIPLIAITGSNGKTTVKEMLRNVFAQKLSTDEVLATEGNLNNHLGVPLTLLSLTDKHKVAIVEMGMNHAGELDYLSKLALPTHAVVNNVLFAHAGHFNGLEDIAKAKGEIYHGLSGNATAFVNSTSNFASMWERDDIHVKNIVKFASSNDDCYIKKLSATTGLFQTPLGELDVSLKVLGQHNYLNALPVIVIAINLGCTLSEIKQGLETYSGYKGRLEQKCAFNDSIIIDDTYNANPDSVKAALSAIQVFNQDKWFIFGDLKELGDNEQQIHTELAKIIEESKINNLLTVGNLAKNTSEAFNGNKLHFASNEDVVKYCFSEMPKNIVLLVKASNSMRFFDIVNQLKKKEI